MFRRILYISIISVLMCSALIPAQSTFAEESDPTIVANVTDDWVEVWGLGTDDLTARLEVKRGPGEDIVCSQNYDPVSGNPWLDCPDSGILPGDIVSLWVNGIPGIEEHVVLDFSLDEFDPGLGEFSGTAPAGRTVFVTVCNPDQDCFDGNETVNPDGSWVVSFGPDTVSPSAGFWATIWEDDWDSTQASFVYPPNMDINITGDWISAWGFGPDDQSARLEVWRGTGPDLMCEGDFDLSDGDPWLDCWQQGVEILPGDQVLLTLNGSLDTVKQHTILDLTVTEVILEDGFFRDQPLIHQLYRWKAVIQMRVASMDKQQQLLMDPG